VVQLDEIGDWTYTSAMQTVANQFADYASYHRTSGNKLFHRIGIPLIMLSLLGMLARVVFLRNGLWQLDAAVILIVLTQIYYLRLEWRLGLAMLLASVAFYGIGRALPFWSLIVLFVSGWVLQFIGHGVYEKKQPAFTRNLIHLLIGPLWILNDVVGAVPAVSLETRG